MLYFMVHLNWQSLLAKKSAISRHDIGFLACLGHIGWSDIDRNNPICVTLPTVAKASIYSVAVAGNFAKNFANVTQPLCTQDGLRQLSKSKGILLKFWIWIFFYSYFLLETIPQISLFTPMMVLRQLSQSKDILSKCWIWIALSLLNVYTKTTNMNLNINDGLRRVSKFKSILSECWMWIVLSLLNVKYNTTIYDGLRQFI